ncbi:MAG: alpha/beta hydrolase [Actinomycetota bacterium]
MRARALFATAIISMMPFAPSKADTTITRTPVSFTVSNPADPLHASYTIHGSLISPAGCATSVLLALHGLSYGAWAWDFPIDPSTYSVAQTLAQRGYAMIAIDELGYGSSSGTGAPDHPNGYTLSVESYAEMTAQIITQIRSGSYGGPAFAHVGVIGHSAGSEIAELTTALHPELVDALIATAYTHEPFVNNNWLVREWSQDNIRAAQSDYEYFETDAATRAQDMYNLDLADPAVVAKDTSLANLTPSGEIFSIGLQPSRFLLPLINKPVLVLLGGMDTLFPASFGPSEMQWFQGTTDKTLDVAPNDGHVFMLHKDAQAADAMIGNWLDAHNKSLPSC